MGIDSAAHRSQSSERSERSAAPVTQASGRPLSSPSQELASLVFIDVNGNAEVRVSGERYLGQIRGAPRSVFDGMRLEMLLVTPGSVADATGDLELIGTVSHVEGSTGNAAKTPVYGGLTVGIGVDTFGPIGSERTCIALSTVNPQALRLPIPVIARFEGMALDGPGADRGQTDAATPFRSADGAPVSSADERMTREPSGVIGTLRQISLAEVIQGLELSRKTARIDIDQGKGKPRGAVFLDAGEVVHARLGSASGEGAFYDLAVLTVGTYRIRFGRRTDRKTVAKPTGFLLLEAMRLADEAAHADAGVNEALEEHTLRDDDAHDDVYSDEGDADVGGHEADDPGGVVLAAGDSDTGEPGNAKVGGTDIDTPRPVTLDVASSSSQMPLLVGMEAEDQADQSAPPVVDDDDLAVVTARLRKTKLMARDEETYAPDATDPNMVLELDSGIHDLPTAHGASPVRPQLVSRGPLFNEALKETLSDAMPSPVAANPENKEQTRRTLKERPPRLRTVSSARAPAQVTTSFGANKVFSGFFAEAESTESSGEFAVIDDAAIVGTQTDSFEAVAG